MVSKTATISIEVIAPLQLRGSSFLSSDISTLRSWGTQKSLLLTPGASYQLTPTVSQVSYQLLAGSDPESSVVTLSNSGLVTSTGVAGSATILARERRDGQVAIVRVNVKPVHHIELKPRAPVYYRVRNRTNWRLV